MPKMTRQARWVGLGLVLSLAGGLGLVAMASAHEGPEGGMPPPPPHMMPGGGMGGPGAMPLGGPMFDRMLDDVQATNEQRTQLRQIAEAARNDVKAQHDAGRTDREQLMKLFTQPTVDAKAAEVLRQQMMTREDTISRRMTQAMLDASKVLTAEQRAQIGQKMAELRERGPMEHGGRRGGPQGEGARGTPRG